MRFAKLLLFLFAGATAAPALAEDVVILRGSSAPPTPWYQPPPEPVRETVYVPVYYLPFAYGSVIHRQHGPGMTQAHAFSARRNR